MNTSPAPADVLLADGTIATIRPMAPKDRPQLLELHDKVSDENTRMRFFSANRKSGRTYVEHLLAADAGAIVLVAVRQGQIVGLATAEVDGHVAEVAFLVADAVHGNGIGTLLLEHLAAAARGRDIEHFTAEVLAENHAMLRVFADAGFVTTKRWSSDVVIWEISTTPGDQAIAAADSREREAERRSLAPLLYPHSVAVVGVRSEGGGIGSAVVTSIRENGFTGNVYVIHPTRDTVADVAAYPSLSEVPEHVDVAVVTVPARKVLATIEDAASAGVSSVVIISSGFGELGPEGIELQRNILQVARKHDIRLLGPNCLGLLCNDPKIRLNATFSPVTPPPGGLAIASQSGGVGIALLDLARERGVGVHSFVSLGNQPDVSGNDLLAAWQDDPAVDAVALYLESFGNSQKFARLARRFSGHKPLLAVVGGRSKSGARGGASHTAAAATPNVVIEALFAQTGVISCRSAEELIRTAQVLSEQPLPGGRRIGIVSNAGGIGILTADAVDDAGLVVPELSPELQAEIARHVDGTTGVGNPIDLGAAATGPDLGAVVDLLARCDEIDALILAVVATSVSSPLPLIEAVSSARASNPSLPVLLVAMGGLHVELGSAPGVTVFATPGDAVQALGHAIHYSEWLTLPQDTWVDFDEDRARAAQTIASELAGLDDDLWLTPENQCWLLAPYGIEPVGEVATGAAEAARAADRIGFPVAIKVADGEVVHKTDRGLVRIGLDSTRAVEEAVGGFANELNDHDVSVLVQPVARGVELVLGITRHPDFGPLVMVGAGGIATDLVDDRAFVVPPSTRREAARALRALRLWPLLEGYRGTPIVDVVGLLDLIVALGQIARDIPQVAEIDLNPVIATPTGPVLVDVKVHLKGIGDHVGPVPRQLSRNTPTHELRRRRGPEDGALSAAKQRTFSP